MKPIKKGNLWAVWDTSKREIISPWFNHFEQAISWINKRG